LPIFPALDLEEIIALTATRRAVIVCNVSDRVLGKLAKCRNHHQKITISRKGKT